MLAASRQDLRINVMTDLFLALSLSYLLGSISFAYIAGRIKGLDLSKEGTGTLGARNAGRKLGKAAGLFILILDILKGITAVAAAGLITEQPIAPLIAWLGVVCGHCWSVFLGFRGGKGLASSAGALLLISPTLLFLEMLIMLVIITIFRNIYLAAIIATVFLPLTVWALGGHTYFITIALLIALMILYRHKNNLADLRKSPPSRWRRK
ncbi:MAG: glycerol-3-phosphate acyltransferase [Proteobacteria bacterium]|nr:glycerol-3-phosphate acyltransferase [Pseudomonadota bacterium]